jgi:hypothetical protein
MNDSFVTMFIKYNIYIKMNKRIGGRNEKRKTEYKME